LAGIESEQENEMTSKAERAQNIAALNDAFRKGERPELGQIIVTSGVRDLVAASPSGVAGVYEQVKRFDAFDDGNDLYGEHDFGSFQHCGETLFFKIDLYEEPNVKGPHGEPVVTRVLTIMLAEEY
jgi:hypothetical protein